MNPDLPQDLASLLHATIADTVDNFDLDAVADAVPAHASAGAPKLSSADQLLKRRVLKAVAAETTPQHLTVQAAGGQWQPFGDGLQFKLLHQSGDTMSYLVRLAAGASLPAHRHPVDEECVVLEGEVQIGPLRVAAGGFHLGRQDLPHDRLRSEQGALIFLRGAPPELATVI